jgi:flagellar biosynthesis activator protein FlaF
MQHHGALAYQQTAKTIESPREREAALLARAAVSFQRIHDDWENCQAELPEALTFNGKLWTVFLTSVTREDSPLPDQVRQNIANLGLFVMNETRELMAQPVPKKLTALININRQLAAGLRGSAQ